MEPNSKVKNNAHVITYLVRAYPEKPMRDVRDNKGQVTDQGIFSLLTMPAIEINTALWYAQDQKWLLPPTDENGRIELTGEPSEWDFGPDELELEGMLLYAFHQLNAKERDLEEFFVSQWTMGYPAHDVLIAVKRLLETQKLHEYEIEDGENKYIFYTLYENRDKLFGRREFKQDPLAEIKRGNKDK